MPASEPFISEETVEHTSNCELLLKIYHLSSFWKSLSSTKCSNALRHLFTNHMRLRLAFTRTFRKTPFRSKTPFQSKNNFSGIDIFQNVDWERPSLFPHFLLLVPSYPCILYPVLLYSCTQLSLHPIPCTPVLLYPVTPASYTLYSCTQLPLHPIPCTPVPSYPCILYPVLLYPRYFASYTLYSCTQLPLHPIPCTPVPSYPCILYPVLLYPVTPASYTLYSCTQLPLHPIPCTPVPTYPCILAILCTSYSCITTVLLHHLLKFNIGKIELLLIGSCYHLSKLCSPITICVDDATITVSEIVRNLGVFIDEQLKLDDHDLLLSPPEHLQNPQISLNRCY